MKEYWVVLYLHDWDPDGKVYPDIHSLHADYADAERERARMSNPEKYHVRRVRETP